LAPQKVFGFSGPLLIKWILAEWIAQNPYAALAARRFKHRMEYMQDYIITFAFRKAHG